MYSQTPSPLAVQMDVLAGFISVAHDSWEMLGNEELFRRHVCNADNAVPYFWEDLLFKLGHEEAAIRNMWAQTKTLANTIGL